MSIPLLLATLVACVGSPGEGKPRAEVSEVPAAAPAAPAPASATLAPPPVAGATVLDVDAAASRLGAVGAKITAKHPIVFPTFAGKVGLDGEGVTGVSFVADVASLQVEPPKLAAHLRKPDFLDVATWPTATFASTAVAAGATEPGATHTVTGDLTIRGKTRRVTFPATIAVAADKVTARTEFVIDRRDFDVVYPGKPDDLVQDDVLMQVDLVAPRAVVASP